MARSTRSRRRLTSALAATSLVLAFAAPVGGAAQAATIAETGPLMNYLVNTRTDPGHIKQAQRAVEDAGGTVVYTHDKIGVIVAQSDNSAFKTDLVNGHWGKAVQSVGATRTAAVTEGPAGGEQSVSGTTVVADPRESEQWDMRQIKADQAHQLTDGSRNVLVGIVDSGMDETHPDLAPNFDAADSVNCIDNGVPNTTPGAWHPTTSDHGQHVAGTVAAARNGVGIVGVAPNVRLAAVKVVNDDGFIYPEYSICGIMWSAAHHMAVTNHSYFIDPWEFWCNDGGDQGAVQESVRRAYAYATGQGVLSVAAAGNSNYDLAHKTTNASSPNDTTPVLRTIDNGCLDLPTELPDVVTVASTTQAVAKSSFSNFGLGVIDVAAPGSSILSTVLNGGYGFKSGTSMASPHVTGVAALIKSTHPGWGPRQIASALRAQADDVACPPTPDPRCTGTTANNAFFGDGVVDALDAVTK